MNPRSLAAFALLLLACGPNPATDSHAAPSSIVQQVDKGTLIVQFTDGNTPISRDFYSNDELRGETNTRVEMSAGHYTITLAPPLDYTPTSIDVRVEERKMVRVTFKKMAPL